MFVNVNIKETLERKVVIGIKDNATDDEIIDVVKELYHDGDIILTADDFKEVEFTVERGKKE